MYLIVLGATILTRFFSSVVEPKEDSPSSLVAAGLPVSESRGVAEIAAPVQQSPPTPVEVAAEPEQEW